MIVDLLRNDIGRFCAAGSVFVEELFAVESYATVHHLVSHVRGTLGSDTTPLGLLLGCMPGGSITGAPKHRAMQLIDELEANRRGWYSGAIGYLAPNGDFDFNVVIRTVLHNAATAKTSFQVGGAITAASSAEGEYAECLLKARALLDALGSDGPR